MMKLLIITQKVDMDDDILGFFHRWLLEFAKHFEFITVIALQVGEYDLPKNVKVLSLGKEKSAQGAALRSSSAKQKSWRRLFFARGKYIYRFYKCIWMERKNYDAVFVHMNPEYVVLGGLLWKFMKKGIYLWYNHKKGGLRVRIAQMPVNRVFFTSPHSFMADFSKARRMPVGIDIAFFKRNVKIERNKNSILSLGRISPVKKIDVFIKALITLDKRGVVFTADIYGNTTDADAEYYREIRDASRILEDKKKVSFHTGVSQAETPAIYNKAQVFVNLTPAGSFDKTIIEAMACENIVIIENKSLKGIIPPKLFFDGLDNDLAGRIEYALSLPDNERRQIGKLLRHNIAEKHSLNNLVVELVKELKK